MNRQLFCFLNCLLLILLAGCWDMVAIEKRGFIIGAAIDLDDESKSGDSQVTMTQQFVIPAKLGTPSQGSGSQQEAFMNVFASGKGLFNIDQKISSKTSKILYLEHLKVLVISEEVAKVPHLFRALLDSFIRDPDLRRGVYVLVSEGEAKGILDIHPEEEKLPAIFLDTLLENSHKKTGLLKAVQIGDIHEFHLNHNSYILPKFKTSKQRIHYVGGAIFQSFKEEMVGTFNEQEMMGVNLITNTNQEGILEFDYEGDLITYKIERVKSNIKINPKDQANINITVNIKVEGDIEEVFGTKDLMNPKTLAKIEKAIAEKVKQLANDAIEKGQKELNADVFRFGNVLKKRHYKLWEKIKDDWDHGENYFSKSEIHVDAHAEIHTTGTSQQTQSNK